MFVQFIRLNVLIIDKINCVALVQFNNRTVGQVASDILLLLCDHADRLIGYYPEIPPRIIEVRNRKNFIFNVRIMITSKHVNSLVMCLTCILGGSVENYSQYTGLDFLLGQALQVNAVLVP
jgi:hypothetical protein